MSSSPMTPSKGIFEKGSASPLALSSGEKKSRFAKQRLAVFMEPSPASTYGETAMSSVPATPLEDAKSGTSRMNHTSGIDPMVKSFTASPFIVGDAHRRSSLNSNSQSRFSGGAILSSPTAQDRPDGKIASSTASSPMGVLKPFRAAPTWRGETEAKMSAGAQSDDPFVSTPGAAAAQDHVALGQNPHKAGLTPTNTTAQAIFPPQACVFVANLSQSETDDQLEHAVTEAFQQFGNVYVKIRRDSRQMPFAFAQYTNVNDAQRAITLGRGMIVSGRPCRTEVARVNRSLYLSKINGGPIAEKEARDIMQGHGNVETLWYASPTERELFRLPEGVFVRFAFFDDCRDVVAKFRESSLYRLEQVKGLEDTRTTPLKGSSGLFSPFKRGIVNQSNYCHTNQHVDKHSIFVGNVPPHLTQDQLATMFQGYGRIVHIEMIRKPSVASSSGVNTFAFIEFDHPQSASAAVQAASRLFQGLRLRIEHKEPANTGHRASNTYKASPRRNFAADSPGFLAAFQRGVTIGMSQAAQSMVPGPYLGQYPYFQAFDHLNPQTELASPAHKDTMSTQIQNSGGNLANAPMHQYSYGITPGPFAQFEEVQSYLPQEAAPSQFHWAMTPHNDGIVNNPLQPL